MDWGVPVFGITADVNAVKLSTKSVRNQLLEEWKKGHGKPEFGGVKFVEPDAASVEAEAPPAMQLCKLLGDGSEQALALPSDVHQKWLADPMSQSGAACCASLMLNMERQFHSR